MTRPLVIRGRAERLPLPDESVDLIVTSPPYFALRSYTDGGQHYAGQIGSEPTPAEYIAALVECTREWMRVLKPSGSAFINLGDKYSGYFNRPDREHQEVPEGSISRNQWLASQRLDPAARYVKSAPDAFGIPYKSLMLLPERYRIACVDQLGLIARAVIVWAKPNGLPESVTDRVRRSHEDWVHLVKQPRYFAAVDEIREGYSEPQRRGVLTWEQRRGRDDHAARYSDQNGHGGTAGMAQSALGKLPGSVWEVATEPLQVPADVAVDHFAAFPSEWPRRLILGWSPSGICTACDQGRRPVVHSPATPRVHKDTKFLHERRTDAKPGSLNDGFDMSGAEWTRWRRENPTTITGYACACPDATAPTRPAVVADCFGGTGTTAHVAAALGRIGISVDLSMDYSRLAAHPELADRRRRKVLGLDKPVLPVVPAGQLGFDWEDVS